MVQAWWDGYVIPRIRRILSKKTKMPKMVRTRIQELLSGLADGLRYLPLSLLSPRRQYIYLSALVDWQQAQLLPVGWGIRYLSVPIGGGVDQIAEQSQPIAQAFWKGFTDSMLIGPGTFPFRGVGLRFGKAKVRTVLERLDWI
jgi:hypothetical protein